MHTSCRYSPFLQEKGLGIHCNILSALKSSAYQFCLSGNTRRDRDFPCRGTGFSLKASAHHFDKDQSTFLGCGPTSRLQGLPCPPFCTNRCATPCSQSSWWLVLPWAVCISCSCSWPPQAMSASCGIAAGSSWVSVLLPFPWLQEPSVCLDLAQGHSTYHGHDCVSLWLIVKPSEIKFSKV